MDRESSADRVPDSRGALAGHGEKAVNKQQLLKWLTDEQQKWELILAAIGESRMETVGVNRTGNWTMRDLIAHLSAWQRWNIAKIRAAVNSQPDPAPVWPNDL